MLMSSSNHIRMHQKRSSLMLMPPMILCMVTRKVNSSMAITRLYCYLPLYIFCGEHLLCARLRTAKNDGAAGTVEELERIVQRIRIVWPDTRVIVRGDSGFCREALMSWCEDNDVHFIIGIGKNNRLNQEIEEELALAKALYQCSGEASRVFKDFCYKTLKTWRWHRRVIGKAEHLSKGANPRFHRHLTYRPRVWWPGTL